MLDRFNESLTHVSPELYCVSHGDYIKQRYSRDAKIVSNVEQVMEKLCGRGLFFFSRAV